MATIYKIHPAIGIARVGDSKTDFYVGAELPANGQPVQNLKDPQHRIKRQAARFRVFAYDRADDGTLSNPRDITGQGAKITWAVHLVNRKAAWDNSVSIGGPRNPHITGAARQDLVIDAQLQTILSSDRGPVACDKGRFKGTVPVTLGELQTDTEGNLLVLGGFGESASEPPNQPVGGVNFADNADWYDDIADGPVSASVEMPGEAAQQAIGAWVAVAPPDFAPAIRGIVTMYDVALHVAVTHLSHPFPLRPSFLHHVQPILARAAALRWTHGADEWFGIDENWKQLSSGTDTATIQLRADLAAFLSGDLLLRDRIGRLRVTPTQRRVLQAFAAGTFDDDWIDPAPAAAATPENYDRAPLEASVGGGFFPGIEAGNRLTDPASYAEPFRLRSNLPPGFVTEQMALPWQSDFLQCRTFGSPGSVGWWPAQRPDQVHSATQPDGPALPWTAGIITLPDGGGGEQQMVDLFAKLGFVQPMIVNGRTVYVEVERDPAFPR